jgi:hypothetical protein
VACSITAKHLGLVPFGLTTNSPQRETVTRKKVARLSAITETAMDLGYTVVPKVAPS